jgi:hypothetical protein
MKKKSTHKIYSTPKTSIKQTREIAKTPPIPKPFDPGVIDLLTNFTFMPAQEEKVDVLFCFGTNRLPYLPAQIIQSFIERSLTNKVLITGGKADFNDIGTTAPLPECAQIFNHLTDTVKDSGVPIYLENKSKNTLENVIEALKLLDFSNSPKVAFVAHSYAARRSYLTLRKFLPHTQLFPNCFDLEVKSFPHNIKLNANNWHQYEKGRQLIWGEFLRIVTYGQRGDIAYEEIQTEANQLKQLIHTPN